MGLILSAWNYHGPGIGSAVLVPVVPPIGANGFSVLQPKKKKAALGKAKPVFYP